MIKHNPHRNERIAAMEADIARRHMQLVDAIREIQDTCSHDKIVTDTLGTGARRICCACGLEEKNRYYSWPGETADAGLYEFARPAGMRTVLNSEFIKVGDVCAQRIRM